MPQGRGALGSIRSIFGKRGDTSPAALPTDTKMGARAPSDEPPPAYDASDATPPTAPVPRANSRCWQKDPYDFLRSFDTIFLIDDSGSMAGSRWRETSQALEVLAPICTAYDRDGIDIRFLNTPHERHFDNVTEASTVHEIFSLVRPSGGTPTGQSLNRIFKAHLAALASGAPKPVNIIVITDGEPSDDVESVIVACARKLDALDAVPWQVGVQFVQVGNDPQARAHLERLDDQLGEMGGGCRDIADTVPFVTGRLLTADVILKVLLGAVNKRLDRRANIIT